MPIVAKLNPLTAVRLAALRVKLRQIAAAKNPGETRNYDWHTIARPKQLPPPGDWATWLLLAGRGFGKTRSGAEYVRAMVKSGRAGRIALIERTPADARDVMIEGESGILAVHPPSERPIYESSKRRLTWPNGAQARVYTSYEPDELRGPQHDLAWAEELCSWQYQQETWDNLMLGLRLGQAPKCLITTTPKPGNVLRDIMSQPTTVVVTGSTYENLENLAPTFKSHILSRYEGTTLGRQELYAEIIDEAPNALWQRPIIDNNRVSHAPILSRIVIGVDPPGGATECGIIIAGISENGHYYILDDRSLRASPNVWARAVIDGFVAHQANIIVGEQNYGGDMVEETIANAAKDRKAVIRYKHVHATRGKAIRAEPIVGLYEQGRIHHVGTFPALESEMCLWVPGETAESPNRIDALVWALTELSENGIGLKLVESPRDSLWTGNGKNDDNGGSQRNSWRKWD